MGSLVHRSKQNMTSATEIGYNLVSSINHKLSSIRQFFVNIKLFFRRIVEGETEASDPLLAEASLYLLRMQGKGGGWPNNLGPERARLGKENKSQHYDKIHPTWVASQALRDRDYKIERPGN